MRIHCGVLWIVSIRDSSMANGSKRLAWRDCSMLWNSTTVSIDVQITMPINMSRMKGFFNAVMFCSVKHLIPGLNFFIFDIVILIWLKLTELKFKIVWFV